MQTTQDDIPSRILESIAFQCSEWVYKELTNEDEAKGNPPSTIEVPGFSARFTVRRFFGVDSANMQNAQKATLIANVQFKTTPPRQYRVLVLAFRGTVSLEDWIVNVGGCAPLWEPFERMGLGVAMGWYTMASNHVDKSVTDISTGIATYKRAMLQAFMEEEGQGATTFLFTGHSLGGALAQIAAMLTLQSDRCPDASITLSGPVRELMQNCRCVTFASPMPFALPCDDGTLLPEQLENQQWAKERALMQFHNFINNNDPVPRLPGELDFIETFLERAESPVKSRCTWCSWDERTVFGTNITATFSELRKQMPMIKGYAPLNTMSFIGHLRHSSSVHGREAQEELRRDCDPDPKSVAVVGKVINLGCGGIPAAVEDHKLEKYRPSIYHLRKVVSGSSDKTLKVWNVLDGICEKTLEGHTSQVCAVAVDFVLGKAVSGSWDKTLKVWNVLHGTCEKTLQGHTQWVTAVAVDFALGKAVSGSHDNTLKVWNVLDGTCEKTLEGHTSDVNAVAVNFALGKAVSGSLDKTLKVWNVLDGTCEKTLQGHRDSVRAVAVDFALGKAVSGSLDKTLKVWNVLDGTCEKTFQGHTSAVRVVAVDFALGKAVSGSDDKTLKVWNVLDGTCEKTMQGHTDGVLAVAVDFALGKAVSSSWDKTLKVWNVLDGACEKTMEGHTSAEMAVSGSRF